MDRVARFANSVDTTCCLCNTGEETHEHFFRCPYAEELLTKMMTVVDYTTCAHDLCAWNERFADARRKNVLFDLRAT